MVFSFGYKFTAEHYSWLKIGTGVPRLKEVFKRLQNNHGFQIQKHSVCAFLGN
jgi:hypothetical protein